MYLNSLIWPPFGVELDLLLFFDLATFLVLNWICYLLCAKIPQRQMGIDGNLLTRAPHRLYSIIEIRYSRVVSSTPHFYYYRLISP